MPILYRSERSTLIPVLEYAAHGSGKTICDYYADRLYKHGLQDIPLISLAAFILREAEESASGVGLGNDMLLIHPNGVRSEFHTDSIRQIQAGIPSLKDAIYSYWPEHVETPEWLKKNHAASEGST
jgi:20S proteasome alpha/beta subunit